MKFRNSRECPQVVQLKYYQFNANPPSERGENKKYANFAQKRTNSRGKFLFFTSLSPLSCLLFPLLTFLILFYLHSTYFTCSLITFHWNTVLVLCSVVPFIQKLRIEMSFFEFLLCSELHESSDELMSKIFPFSRDTFVILLRIYDDRERNFLFTLTTSSRLIKLSESSHKSSSLEASWERKFFTFAHETNDY